MKKILVVEDDPTNMTWFEFLLEEQYAVLKAEDGEAALLKAEGERPDLILMNLSLPVLDGWEATRQLKANPQTQSIPVIAVTAHSLPPARDEAKRAGCDALLIKPIDEQALLALVAQYLTAQEGRGERT